jgi:hypothetical protein
VSGDFTVTTVTASTICITPLNANGMPQHRETKIIDLDGPVEIHVHTAVSRRQGNEPFPSSANHDHQSRES